VTMLRCRCPGAFSSQRIGRLSPETGEYILRRNPVGIVMQIAGGTITVTCDQCDSTQRVTCSTDGRMVVEDVLPAATGR
jgi:hypothetical protein